MSNTKEIRTKITSIESTQKITKAMEMVAASKMRKAQQFMKKSRSYADCIRNIVGHLALASTSYQHIYMQSRPVKRIGLIVVSTDRGLCGGLNTNTFKYLLKFLQAWREADTEVDLCTLGYKADVFFKKWGNVIASKKHLGEAPSVNDLIGAIKVMLSAYESSDIDQLYIVYNCFINTMTQKPIMKQLLPLEPIESDALGQYWDYIYEPSPESLLNGLLVRYIESQIYQAVLDNQACEQAARMVAMKSATDNAGSLIDDLQLIYNKARQAAITQEISEIVGGASAV
ncbi:MAG: F0F1 ATP synthase subunit gamma [Endozoicomonadaceae bacterium]|nr:F0F1 ATP synthase subunit gamma [Endozoicomonadaceae bacterium]MBE8233190.1 F0F1 ATP synthase subunit gamma [Endozoicomonadaceae bacterium]